MGVCLEARLEMVFFHWKTKTRDGGSFGGPAGDALSRQGQMFDDIVAVLQCAPRVGDAGLGVLK